LYRSPVNQIRSIRTKSFTPSCPEYIRPRLANRSEHASRNRLPLKGAHNDLHPQFFRQFSLKPSITMVVNVRFKLLTRSYVAKETQNLSIHLVSATLDQFKTCLLRRAQLIAPLPG